MTTIENIRRLYAEERTESQIATDLRIDRETVLGHHNHPAVALDRDGKTVVEGTAVERNEIAAPDRAATQTRQAISVTIDQLTTIEVLPVATIRLRMGPPKSSTANSGIREVRPGISQPISHISRCLFEAANPVRPHRHVCGGPVELNEAR